MKKRFLTELILACLMLTFTGCKERETQYTYYDDAKTKPNEVYEVDKETGKKDGKYKRFDESGNLRLECLYKDGKRDNCSAITEQGKTSFKCEDGKCISSMTDSRDGQDYKVVLIGYQVWMAENLNYATMDSYCYPDEEYDDLCGLYGRLYTWDAAINACPAGWHLPSNEEFEMLVSDVGGEKVAGKMLKSNEWWTDNYSKSGGGTDDFGFKALPAGLKLNHGFDQKGEIAYFWSSKVYKRGDPSWRHVWRSGCMSLYYGNDRVRLDSQYLLWGGAVRCVKD